MYMRVSECVYEYMHVCVWLFFLPNNDLASDKFCPTYILAAYFVICLIVEENMTSSSISDICIVSGTGR